MHFFQQCTWIIHHICILVSCSLIFSNGVTTLNQWTKQTAKETMIPMLLTWQCNVYLQALKNSSKSPQFVNLNGVWLNWKRWQLGEMIRWFRCQVLLAAAIVISNSPFPEMISAIGRQYRKNLKKVIIDYFCLLTNPWRLKTLIFKTDFTHSPTD